MPGSGDPGDFSAGTCRLYHRADHVGASTRRFAFEAFLPSDKKEKQAVLKELETETRTVIMYEAPHRLVKPWRSFTGRWETGGFPCAGS